MNVVDLAQAIRALQRHNAEARLAKVDDFLTDALDRLSSLELDHGAYSKAAIGMLLRLPAPASPQHHHQQQQQQPPATEGSRKHAGIFPVGLQGVDQQSQQRVDTAQHDVASFKARVAQGSLSEQECRTDKHFRHSNGRVRGDHGRLVVEVAAEMQIDLDATTGVGLVGVGA